MGEEFIAAGHALPSLHVGQHTHWAFCKARVSQGSGLLQVIHILSLSILLPSLPSSPPSLLASALNCFLYSCSKFSSFSQKSPATIWINLPKISVEMYVEGVQIPCCFTVCVVIYSCSGEYKAGVKWSPSPCSSILQPVLCCKASYGAGGWRIRETTWKTPREFQEQGFSFHCIPKERNRTNSETSRISRR